MINPKKSTRLMAWILATFPLSLIHPLSAQKNGASFSPNLADETIAENFSADRAIVFIEDSVSRWQSNRKCVTCHTNGLHLVAASLATPTSKVFLENRKFARDYVSGYISGKSKPIRQYGAIEGIVAASSFLAISEMTTGTKLHPDTASALCFHRPTTISILYY